MDGNNRYWEDGMRHAHDGFWGGPIHLIVLLVLLALLVAGAVWLTRRLSHGGLAAVAAPVTPHVGHDPAVAALRLRYASGGVSREEFRQAMGDLTGIGPPAATAPEASGGDEGAPTAS